MKKTISTIIALALAATVAVAQEAKPAQQPQVAAPKATADPIVIAAGDVTVRQSEFEGAVKSLPDQYQEFAMGAGKKKFAEDYIKMKLLATEGMKGGLDKDPDVVKQLSLMRENLVATAQLHKIEKGITFTDEELKKIYDAHKGEYETVKARHILIAFKGSAALQPGKPELTEEQAKAKAEDIRKQIVGGASFEELAKKESDDTGSGATGGDLGEFSRGQMVPEFEKAVFGAKPGDITPVVRTQYGYHVIKVESHGTTPFETVKPYLEKTQRQERLQAQLDAMQGKATYNEAYFPPEKKPEEAQKPEETKKPEEAKKQ